MHEGMAWIADDRRAGTIREMAMTTRVPLARLAFGLILASSAVGQTHDMSGMTHMTGMAAMGGKVDYDPEPGGGDADPPANCQGVAARVTIVGGVSFSPASVTIHQGEPVCWTWEGSAPHTVTADDGSFNSGGPNDFGTFQRTFATPGTFGYYCQVHGSSTGGMRGSVTVLGADDPPGSGPGTLAFAPEAYTAEENAGILTVTVARTGGSDGAASVKFATANGTARNGKDFTPRKGTLTWAAGDQEPRVIEVPIKNDAKKEADEAFTIKLSKAAGSALGAAVATVTIHDDDSSPCTAALSAPARLAASGISESEVRLEWSVEAAAARSLRLERRSAGGDFREIAALPADERSFTDGALPRGATFHYRLRLAGEEGFSAYSPIAAAATDGAVGACSESEGSACLGGGRFEARLEGRRVGAHMSASLIYT